MAGSQSGYWILLVIFVFDFALLPIGLDHPPIPCISFYSSVLCGRQGGDGGGGLILQNVELV
jgi:hypothetical protein